MTRRDVVERITHFNRGREPERLRLKYQAMASDPFTFLRGTCHLFYEDWPQSSALNQAPATWVCGDLHLENFGTFKGDNRLTYFDMNDFDEAALAPGTWDTARFLTSLLVFARVTKLDGRDATTLCGEFVDTYAGALAQGKPRWVERSTAEGIVKDLLGGLRRRRRVVLLDSRTESDGRRRRLRLDGRRALPVSAEDRQRVEDFMARFAARQPDPRFFKVQDVARRIAGTGSLGLERYVILVRGRGNPDGNFLLDLKHQPGSALQPYVELPQPRWRTEAERVVAVQQRMQAASPAFLQAVRIGRRPYLLRELMPRDDRLSFTGRNRKLKQLAPAIRTMAQVVAWGQLRGGRNQGAASIEELADFGHRKAWRKPLVDYVRHYAEQVEEDWRAFRQAWKDGVLVGRI